jgi:hypothetical protein
MARPNRGPSFPRRVTHAASLHGPSQSVRNSTTWFQLGVIRDAGPEITNGLGAFLYGARSKPGFGWAFALEAAAPESRAALIGQLGHQVG